MRNCPPHCFVPQISIGVHFCLLMGRCSRAFSFCAVLNIYPKQTVLWILLSVCSVTGLSPPPLVQGEILETVTTACVCLFAHQTTLADQVPPLGHIPRILGRMKATNNIIPRSCALVIHVLADSDVSAPLRRNGYIYTVYKGYIL